MSGYWSGKVGFLELLNTNLTGPVVKGSVLHMKCVNNNAPDWGTQRYFLKNLVQVALLNYRADSAELESQRWRPWRNRGWWRSRRDKGLLEVENSWWDINWVFNKGRLPPIFHINKRQDFKLLNTSLLYQSPQIINNQSQDQNRSCRAVICSSENTSFGSILQNWSNN